MKYVKEMQDIGTLVTFVHVPFGVSHIQYSMIDSVVVSLNHFLLLSFSSQHHV